MHYLSRGKNVIHTIFIKEKEAGQGERGGQGEAAEQTIKRPTS